jgi:hypothetical protein
MKGRTMSIEIVAWEEFSDQTPKHTYKVQVRSKSLRQVNSIFKNGWNNAGEGFSPKTKQYIRIYSRLFKERSEWYQFAKSLDYRVVEIKKNGKEKVYNVRKSSKK